MFGYNELKTGISSYDCTGIREDQSIYVTSTKSFTVPEPEMDKLDPKNIEKIIFNNPATIIIYKDGSKIVSKANNEDFDPEKGVMACFMKLIFESRGEFVRMLDEAVEKSGLNKKEDI